MGIIETAASVSDSQAVSFLGNPVIVVENFWSAEERQYFREAMNKATWKSLEDLPHVREDFPNSGNWAKAEIAQSQAQRFLSRLQLPCVQEHIESFPDIVGRHVGFNYYSYASGDCLLAHDDTDQGYATEGKRAPLRRIAVVTYFHEEWRSDLGGN